TTAAWDCCASPAPNAPVAAKYPASLPSKECDKRRSAPALTQLLMIEETPFLRGADEFARRPTGYRRRILVAAPRATYPIPARGPRSHCAKLCRRKAIESALTTSLPCR